MGTILPQITEREEFMLLKMLPDDKSFLMVEWVRLLKIFVPLHCLMTLIHTLLLWDLYTTLGIEF